MYVCLYIYIYMYTCTSHRFTFKWEFQNRSRIQICPCFEPFCFHVLELQRPRLGSQFQVQHLDAPDGWRSPIPAGISNPTAQFFSPEIPDAESSFGHLLWFYWKWCFFNLNVNKCRRSYGYKFFFLLDESRRAPGPILVWKQVRNSEFDRPSLHNCSDSAWDSLYRNLWSFVVDQRYILVRAIVLPCLTKCSLLNCFRYAFHLCLFFESARSLHVRNSGFGGTAS